MSSFKDRTAELRSCVDSIAKRSALPKSNKTVSKPGSKSEVARMASAIAKDINSTTLKLSKLAQLAKRKTLFDDRPVEISELTYIIKQDIADLNKQISQLQALTKKPSTTGGGGKDKDKEKRQVDEHNSNVVMLLQSKLANMGMGFKDVLEIRTQNMKASKDRTEQFMYTTSNAAGPSSHSILSQPPPSTRPTSPNGYPVEVNGRSAPRSNGDYLALDMGDSSGVDGGRGGEEFMRMQMVEQQDNYITQRSTAIETIESTIAELGTIFSQLANMVAEQAETVQRIDADTTDISNNVSGAQRELLKYYASVSSNRWLMLKIFGVLIIFFLLFILVT